MEGLEGFARINYVHACFQRERHFEILALETFREARTGSSDVQIEKYLDGFRKANSGAVSSIIHHPSPRESLVYFSVAAVCCGDHRLGQG